MTNGDRLRKMTDEELSDKLTDKCAVCAYWYSECGKKFCLCEQGVLEWLKQEVNDESAEEEQSRNRSIQSTDKTKACARRAGR